MHGSLFVPAFSVVYDVCMFCVTLASPYRMLSLHSFSLFLIV